MEKDRKNNDLLLAGQKGVAVVPLPYDDLARQIGITEKEVLACLNHFQHQGLIRDISARFDLHRAGFESVLIGATYPANKVNSAARKISRHPGVSHNYLRKHELNLWFTLALPRNSRLGVDGTARYFQEKTHPKRLMILPAEKSYKSTVCLDPFEKIIESCNSSYLAFDPPSPVKLSETDISTIRSLQESFPICSRPFAHLAAKAGLSEEVLLERTNNLLQQKVLRRIGIVLDHYAAGFCSNAMICWRVETTRIDTVAGIFCACQRVSHCYIRPVYPDWPYNLYTMLHARYRHEAEVLIADLARRSAVSDYQVLYSTRQYKKERIHLFSPRFEQWESAIPLPESSVDN